MFLSSSGQVKINAPYTPPDGGSQNLFIVTSTDSHAIATISGTLGSEVSWNFQQHGGQGWKIGMDYPTAYEDGFSVKTTNNADPEFYVHNNGNVGIGMADPLLPQRQLHLYSGESAPSPVIGSATKLLIEDDSTVALQFLTPYNVSQYIYFGNPDDVDAGYIAYRQYDNDPNGQQLIISAGNVGSSGSIYIGRYGADDSIGANNRVGVNAYNPKFNMHVKQDIDTFNDGGGIGITNSTAQTHWQIIVQGGAGGDLNFAYGSVFGAMSAAGYLRNGSNVGQITFTGQHRPMLHNSINFNLSASVGLIIISTGEYQNLDALTPGGLDNIAINEALPLVKFSNIRNQKSVFGVISNHEDIIGREHAAGNFVSSYNIPVGDNRVLVNSLGEGAIWVCNVNGDLENGDYITSCEIPGHGMRQDDDLMHNYTVAKITCDCDFDLSSQVYTCEEFVHEGMAYRRAFVGCTYHCG